MSPPEQYAEINTLFGRAIELDPQFAIAYANRGGFGDAKFGFNYETSDELLLSIRADLATAKRLAPTDPFVLAAEAGHLAWCERDLPRAQATFEAAMDAGLADSVYLASYAILLQRLGRNAEAYALQMRAVSTDPANPFILTVATIQLASLLRADEAIRMADRAIELYPERPFLRLVRAQVIYNHTGRADELHRELTAAARHVPAQLLLDLGFPVLMNDGAYDELQALLDSLPENEIRAVPGPGGGGPLFCVGKRPLAQYRGWLALARGNLPEANRWGAEVLDFVARQPITVQNGWFLQVLTAHGYLLQGRHEEAIAAAREAAAAWPVTEDRFGAYSTAQAAFILLTCGATEEAIAMLETLFEDRGLTGVGAVLHSPRVAAALAGDARYQALRARLADAVKACPID